MGPGEVWIDDVQLYGLAFTKRERVELSKLIALADVKLQNGQWGQCARLLESYWPQFLEANVPLRPSTIAPDALAGQGQASNNPPSPPAEPPPERSGLLERFKSILPRQFRF